MTCQTLVCCRDRWRLPGRCPHDAQSCVFSSALLFRAYKQVLLEPLPPSVRRRAGGSPSDDGGGSSDDDTDLVLDMQLVQLVLQQHPDPAVRQQVRFRGALALGVEREQGCSRLRTQGRLRLGPTCAHAVPRGQASTMRWLAGSLLPQSAVALYAHMGGVI